MSRGFLERLKGFVWEVRCAQQFAPASRPRYLADIVGFRLLRLAPSLASDHARTLRLRDGTRLSYRLNRGDIQAIREIWLMPTYLPPFPAERLDVCVDVGANIGFATLYYARRHGARVCVAVEPDTANAELLRRNLAQNGVDAIVLEAAVGARDGSASFAKAGQSNLGHVADSGVPVRMVSMPTVLAQLDGRRVDMLKVDIEGGERELFAGDTGWLDRVNAIMIELHPTLVEPRAIVEAITARGFRHVPAGSVRVETSDAFVR